MDIKKSLTTVPNLDISGPLNLNSDIAANQLAFQYFNLSTLNQPYVGSGYSATTYGVFEPSSPRGGISISGLTDNGSTPLTLSGFIGSASPTQAAIQFIGAKSDGAGSIQALSSSEKVLSYNNLGSNIFDIYGNGFVGINAATRTDSARLAVRAPSLTTGTGTISNNNGATAGTVVGTGTAFTTELAVGDQIGILGGSGTQSTVRTIVDDTHLTVDYYGLWPAGTSFQISKPSTRFLNNGNEYKAGVYPFGGVTAANYHALNAGSLIALSDGGLSIPGLGFGFLDPTFNHTMRTAGGSNLDLMLDVCGTSSHFFGVNGLFKTGYGATIGDSTFAISAPSNGLYVVGDARANANLLVGLASAGASANKVLALSNSSTAPSTSVDMCQLYGTDISAGNATLGIYTETAVAADIGLVSTDSLTVFINGTKYKIPLVLA